MRSLNQKLQTLIRIIEGNGAVLIIAAALTLALQATLTPEAAGAGTRIAYWQLEENSAPYLDATSTHNGQCAGGCPTSSLGQVNNGQQFDGTTSGITISADTAFNWNAADNFSIEMWFKADPAQTCVNGAETLIGRADSGSGPAYWALGCDSAGKATFQINDSSNTNISLQSGRVITDGLWHHIVAARDGNNDINALYVDVTDAVSITQSFSGDLAPPSAPIVMGSLEGAAYFAGTMDEVSIYNGVLSASEMAEHYYLVRGYADACTIPVRIMPLGDSITRGAGTGDDPSNYAYNVGYRRPLFLNLDANSHYADFVGGEYNGYLDSGTPFDYDHEGHGGRTDLWISRFVFDFLSLNPADVVLLHIGTNNLDPSPAEVEIILDEIDRYSEDVTVIMALIVDQFPNNPDVTAFNNNIEALAQARIANGDKIIIVDMQNALNYATDMYDSVHPNQSGYDKMAAVWLNALDDFLPVCDYAPIIRSAAVVDTPTGLPYDYTVFATGSPPPTYTLTAAPAGMTIDTNTGVISWTPASAQTVNVTIEARNSQGVAVQSYSLDVIDPAPPSIYSTPVTQVGVNSSYSYNVDASGYPYPTYALTTAPAGMTIVQDTGRISWRPDTTGIVNVSVDASNFVSVDTQSFYITVTEAPAITSTPITQVGLSLPYNYDVDASGFPTPTYALRHAPANMSISAETGLIGWTPGSSGMFSVTVEAQNIADIAAQGFTITVTEEPAILSTPLTTIELGQAYSHTVQASGYPTPTFSLTEQPVNMSIGVDNGVIAWTPTAVGVYSVGVQASNIVSAALQTFAITVTQAPAFVSTPITEVGVGGAYAYNVDASGFPTPTYSLPTAPAGMNIDANTGAITWAPTLTGTFSVIVQASNTSADATQSFDITVTEAAAIVSTAVTEIGAGNLYNYDVQATGYPTPTYALTAAPTGMTIDPDTGLIAWTPGSGGEYDVTVTASNSVNTAVQNYVLMVTETAVITTVPITQTSVGQLYNYDVDATGYPTPTFALTNPPSGMSIDPDTGLIAWTPGAGGVYPVTVTASNAVGSQNQAFNLMATQTPAIVSTPVTEIGINQSYSYDVSATGYPAPTFSLTDAPDGMSIDPDTGLINWAPTISGLFDVTVTAVNAAGSTTQIFALAVTEAPTITSTPLFEASVGQPYNYTVTTDGYPAPTFTLTTAPNGMTIDQNSGLIAWTPDAGGVFTVTVSADNGVDTAVQTFDITVNEYFVFLPVVFRSGP